MWWKRGDGGEGVFTWWWGSKEDPAEAAAAAAASDAKTHVGSSATDRLVVGIRCSASHDLEWTRLLPD